MPERHESIRAMLEAHGQEHVLAFSDQLTPAERGRLLEQVQSIDFDRLDDLIERYVRTEQHAELPDDLEPAPYYPRDPGPTGRDALPYDAAHFRQVGEELIRQGKVAAFTVAGGQGTRLGWNGPKGSYPATVVTGKPLFRVFAEQILATQKRYGVTIPWLIMTSPMNDDDTRAFFLDNNCFGLLRQNIYMFPQGMMPSLDAATGRILLADRHELAMNPDGHGGSISALAASGAVDDLVAHGIEHISYFQVDNPIVRAIDPLFLGLHAEAPDSSAEMSSKMVPKAAPDEKVGVFCRSRGKNIVIEYSDLPEALAEQRDDDGRLRFLAGSIAIHIIGVEFVRTLTGGEGGFALPWHRAVKKVPHVDPGTGRRVDPDQPNAVKLETFVFDALPFAASSIIYETSRLEEFAPIKNAHGVDSPATSHQIQSDRHGGWLEAHGVTVPRASDGNVDARIEISPLSALEPADLVAVDLPERVAPGEEITL